MTAVPSRRHAWPALLFAPLWWPWQQLGWARWRRTQRRAGGKP